MIFSMNTDSYPGNPEIQEILEAIEQIRVSKDWAALEVAETELQFILLDKREWVKYNGFENNSSNNDPI